MCRLKLALFINIGLWVVNDTALVYSIEGIVTFWCFMRFDKYPLDDHTCKLQVGSYSFNEKLMKFNTRGVQYDRTKNYVVLDFTANIEPLQPEDHFYLNSKKTSNFSVAGFEVTLSRNRAKYILNYYFPSGMFVIVSWVCSTNNIAYIICCSYFLPF